MRVYRAICALIVLIGVSANIAAGSPAHESTPRDKEKRSRSVARMSIGALFATAVALTPVEMGCSSSKLAAAPDPTMNVERPPLIDPRVKGETILIDDPDPDSLAEIGYTPEGLRVAHEAQARRFEYDESEEHHFLSPRNLATKPKTPESVLGFGKKAWDFVKDNKPTVEVTPMLAHALPKGFKGNWESMEGWRTRVLGRVLKWGNFYGFDLVNFEYNLVYSYNGTLDGNGLYLSNVTVVAKDLQVRFIGINVKASTEIYGAHNAGTIESPIASIFVRVDYEVQAPYQNLRGSDLIEIRGDGTYDVLQSSKRNE